MEQNLFKSVLRAIFSCCASIGYFLQRNGVTSLHAALLEPLERAPGWRRDGCVGPGMPVRPDSGLRPIHLIRFSSHSSRAPSAVRPATTAAKAHGDSLPGLLSTFMTSRPTPSVHGIVIA